MRRFPAILVAICLWCVPVFAEWPGDFNTGVEHLKAGRYAQARDAFTKALQSEWVTPQERGKTYFLRGLSQAALGDLSAARADLDEAVKLLPDFGPALAVRCDLAWRTGDREQALKDLLHLARDFPSELNDVEVSRLWAFWRWLKEGNRADDQFLLLETVLKAGYTPSDPGSRPDGLVEEYVRMLIERGKRAEALSWAKKIISTSGLLEMRASASFRALWNDRGFNAHSRPRAAAERDLQYWEATARKHPKSLKVVLRHMQALRTLGAFDKAIQVGESVSKNAAAYEDDSEYRAWVLNEQAYALQDAGRIEDAVTLMAPLLERSAEKEPYLVSQFINYGITLLYAGKPEQALAAVDKAKGRVSPYGQKWIDSTQACAYHQLKRDSDAETAIKRLKTNPEQNYAALSRALLCLNRIDEAVQLALVRLRDPDHRMDMLMNLQTYRQPDGMPVLARELAGRWEAVRKNPEVLAEARKHGRLMNIPLYPIYWGDV